MTGSSNPDNLLGPGDFISPDPNNPLAPVVLGAQTLSRGAANLLWRGAKGVLGDAWDLAKPPLDILSGKATPYPGRLGGPDDPVQYVNPAGYAGQLAQWGAGVRAPSLLTKGGAFDSTVLPSFFAWHGTGANPFMRFERGKIGTGEGNATYGRGTAYVAEQQPTAQVYKEQQYVPGQEGGLLYLNVKPNQHEFFDWNAPWEEQDPGVKKKLESIGFDHPSVSQRMVQSNVDDPVAHGAALYFSGPENTGERLYKQLARQYHEIAGPGTGEYGLNEGMDYVSKRMEEAGIPGIKYLDQLSRHRGVDLDYKPGWENTPAGISPLRQIGGDVFGWHSSVPIDAAVNSTVRDLRSNADSWENYVNPTNPTKKYGQHFRPQADWLENEYKVNPDAFAYKDNRSRNFVVFNPADIDILTWDGKPISEVMGK